MLGSIQRPPVDNIMMGRYVPPSALQLKAQLQILTSSTENIVHSGHKVAYYFHCVYTPMFCQRPFPRGLLAWPKNILISVDESDLEAMQTLETTRRTAVLPILRIVTISFA